MKTRKEKYENVKKSKAPKLVIAAIILSASIGTGNVAFANQDINGLLASWFDKKTTESISEIENAINVEKEENLTRLKVELQSQMKKTEKEINEFTELEKKKRVEELRRYTDELINGIKISNEEERKQVSNELDTIMKKSIDQINAVKTTVDSKIKVENEVKSPEVSKEKEVKSPEVSKEKEVISPEVSKEKEVKSPEVSEENVETEVKVETQSSESDKVDN